MEIVLYILIPILIVVLGIYYLLYKRKQRRSPQENNTSIDKSHSLTPSGCLGAFLFVIIVIALFVWIIPGFSGGYNKAKEKHEVQSNAAQYTESEYKELCQSVTYEEIARDGNAKSGEYFKFSGEVLQEIEDGVYRLAVNDSTDYIIFAFDSNGTRILEGDAVTIWGESVGFVKGETIFGENVKAPKIEAVYVTINNVNSKAQIEGD